MCSNGNAAQDDLPCGIFMGVVGRRLLPTTNECHYQSSQIIFVPPPLPKRIRKETEPLRQHLRITKLLNDFQYINRKPCWCLRNSLNVFQSVLEFRIIS